MPLILEHFWLKLAAVVIGFLLWFHVATEKVYNHEIHLPVTEIALDDSLTLSKPPPESLTVIVSSTGKQLLRTGWRRRGLRINATKFHSGHYMVNLNMNNTSLVDATQSVTLDEIISSSSTAFDIDYLSSKTVDVLLDLAVDPDDGFAVNRISAPEPNQVTVEGARAMLRRINAVNTVHKELSGLRSNIEVTLPLLPPNGYKMCLAPESVLVTIEIVPVKTRVFKSIPIVAYNTPPESDIQLSPTSLDIELTGPPDDIDLLNRNALVASVDFQKRDSAGNATIKIECPSRFRVKRSSNNTVIFSFH
ncbi:MAG: YbbR-like domain-containing protein [candidate division Zixibacteria bacterium]|nr:YbbR-like domain-containing protein [candidate division Zixibacteria bacterium]